MKLMIHGAAGRMGVALTQLVQNSPDITVVGAVDALCPGQDMVASLDQCTEKADCVVDFSHHTATADLLAYCTQNNTPVVICTTGHDRQELDMIADAAKQIPVFHSGNMSVGIALLMRLAKQTAQMFPDADIEIVETHHNQKLDVPSGTALMLAKSVQEARPDSQLLVGRHENGKRQKKDIGIHSLRMGGIVGIHQVLVSTGNQTITLKHEAHSRALFAEGAITAALWLTNQPAGLYDMKDLVK